MSDATTSRIAWPEVLERARAIVAEYDTAVTLRQLFYRLVAVELLPNARTAYKTLSSRTAQARREGTFPDLVDNGRDIHEPMTFADPDEAREWLTRVYRRDRTEFMDVSIYIGVEKATMVAQLESWFGERGLPILALSGYASQSYVDEVRIGIWARIEAYHERNGGGIRDTVPLYAGDFDPSGEDIGRDFRARVHLFDKVVKVALTPEQVDAYGLPPALGKATDSRANGFRARHGRLGQVELEALAPDVLRGLYEDALAPFWDVSAFERSRERERADLAELDEGRG